MLRASKRWHCLTEMACTASRACSSGTQACIPDSFQFLFPEKTPNHPHDSASLLPKLGAVRRNHAAAHKPLPHPCSFMPNPHTCTGNRLTREDMGKHNARDHRHAVPLSEGRSYHTVVMRNDTRYAKEATARCQQYLAADHSRTSSENN